MALSSAGNIALIGGIERVWIYTLDDGTWTDQQKLTDGGSPSPSSFGAWAALSSAGDTVLLGGLYNNSVDGASWLFENNAPTVETGPASEVMPTSATLNATVNPKGTLSKCEFEYSETMGGPWTSEACSPFPSPGSTPAAVSASVPLTADTTYYYRVSATNADGTNAGSEQTFTTLLNSGSESTSSPSVPASVTDGPLSATASGGVGTVTIGQYSSSPSGTPPLKTGVGYIDVYLSAVSTPFTSLEFKDCDLNGAKVIKWLNPAVDEYETISEPPATYEANAIPGPCITVVLTDSTTPDLTDMTGTVLAVGYPPPAAPEFGRCVKVTTGSGKYGASGCTSTGGKSDYEWEQGVVKTGFATRLTSGSITLESVAKSTVTCSGETSGGEYTGVKTVGMVSLTLTGCTRGTEKCASAATAGEIVTRALEGELGVEKLGATSAKNKIALDLHPKTGVVAQFTCGATTVDVQGSVIVPIKSNKMYLTQALKFKASKGKQKPESFVGGPKDVLEESFNSPPFQQAGLTMDITETNVEAVEVNSVV